MGIWGRRLCAWFLPLVLVLLVTSCAAAPRIVIPTSPIAESGIGEQTVHHPVSSLDLVASVPPGGEPLMPAPLTGEGPMTQGYGNLGPAEGKRGTIVVEFVCSGVNSSGFPFVGSAVWPGRVLSARSSLACNPTPYQISGCAGPGCYGQIVNIVTLPNAAGAALPAINISSTASWTLFAWLDPRVQPPTAGVTQARPGLSHFLGYGLALDYPAAWRALAPPYAFWGLESPTSSLFLSTSPLHEPCKITAGKNGSTHRGPCHTPISGLAPGGVYVSWTYTGDGTNWLSKQPGRKATLAGQPARLISARPQASASYGAGTCESLHASWLVAAAISLGPYSIDRMVACVRAGRTSRQVKQVMAMLHSMSLQA